MQSSRCLNSLFGIYCLWGKHLSPPSWDSFKWDGRLSIWQILWTHASFLSQWRRVRPSGDMVLMCMGHSRIRLFVDIQVAYPYREGWAHLPLHVWDCTGPFEWALLIFVTSLDMWHVWLIKIDKLFMITFLPRSISSLRGVFTRDARAIASH